MTDDTRDTTSTAPRHLRPVVGDRFVNRDMTEGFRVVTVYHEPLPPPTAVVQWANGMCETVGFYQYASLVAAALERGLTFKAADG